MSGGGGFLGGGQPVPSGEGNAGGGNAPESGDDGIQIVATPAEGGLLDQVESDTGDDSEVVEAMYDDRMINDVHWTVIEADYLGEVLPDGTESENGELVGVVYQIENLTGAPITLIDLEVADGDDNIYSYSLEMSGTLEDGCSNIAIEPEMPLTCTAIFDVPLDATDLHVVLTDFNMLGGAEEKLDLELD